MKKHRIPPMLVDIVQATLASCDGALFDSCGVCPECGGKLAGYDIKKKQFAILTEGDQTKTIYVLVKRFRCSGCRKISLADQPFYPGTRIGSPVVDLCVTLGETLSCGRVSSCLAEMGVVVDRWSVRHYSERKIPGIAAVDMFGIRVPISLVSLSSLSMGLCEGSCIDASSMLAACGYPSRKAPSGDLPPES